MKLILSCNQSRFIFRKIQTPASTQSRTESVLFRTMELVIEQNQIIRIAMHNTINIHTDAHESQDTMDIALFPPVRSQLTKPWIRSVIFQKHVRISDPTFDFFFRKSHRFHYTFWIFVSVFPCKTVSPFFRPRSCIFSGNLSNAFFDVLLFFISQKYRLEVLCGRGAISVVMDTASGPPIIYNIVCFSHVIFRNCLRRTGITDVAEKSIAWGIYISDATKRTFAGMEYTSIFSLLFSTRP